MLGARVLATTASRARRLSSATTSTTLTARRCASLASSPPSPSPSSSSSSSSSSSLSSSLDARVSRVLAALPRVAVAVAYGSAVLPQRGYTDAQRRSAQLDLLLVVDDVVSVDADADAANGSVDGVVAWHEANMRAHASHYSGTVRYVLGGARGAAALQHTSTGALFHTDCAVAGEASPVKYGVVARSRLVDDMRSWRSFALAARLHKPVLLYDGVSHARVHVDADADADADADHTADIDGGRRRHRRPAVDEFVRALDDNRTAALCAALLLAIGEHASSARCDAARVRVSLRSLFSTLAALSYDGDVRMLALLSAENPHKVDNIVAPNVRRFVAVYSRALARLARDCADGDDADDAMRVEYRSDDGDGDGNGNGDSDSDGGGGGDGGGHVVMALSTRTVLLLLARVPPAFATHPDASSAAHASPTLSPSPTSSSSSSSSSSSTHADARRLASRAAATLRRRAATANRCESAAMIVKGVVSAGPWRALLYALRKRAKSRAAKA